MTTPVSPIQHVVERLHAQLKDNHDGKVATYIPELGKADPDWFGICLVTADGQVYQAGDCAQEFTIQSISKPFVYGIALEDQGTEAVLEKIWMEPSGEAFNAISLRPDSGKPANPMINAGAIASASLVEGSDKESKIARIVEVLGKHAGRGLSVDESVYRSESSTGHRNRAIGYMLRNFDILEEDPTATLEAYFMQCSISVTCRDLGMMAATLANGGTNPVTGVRAVDRKHVESILSVMGSCGMYDAAGEWIYNVGMPAKSGVAGGILAVLPGQLGIGVFSPRLDSVGNSVRGVEVCREISRGFGLHMFQVPQLASASIRREGNLSHCRSSRLRSPKEMEALRDAGDSIKVLELQGDLIFGTAEFVSRSFVSGEAEVREMVVDCSHVTGMNDSAATVLAQSFVGWLEAGQRISVIRTDHLGLLVEKLEQELDDDGSARLFFYEDTPTALEEVENRLLDDLGLRRHSSEGVELEDCPLLRDLDPAALEMIGGFLKPVDFDEGAVVMKIGDAWDGMYFLMRGKASAWITTATGHGRRIATFSPGMSFGEMGLVDQAPRSAEIRADSPLNCLMLDVSSFEALSNEGDGLKRQLLENLTRILADRLREANEEISALHG